MTEPSGRRCATVAAMEIGCLFPPTIDTPDHVRVAEQLGYRLRLRLRLAGLPRRSLDDARSHGGAHLADPHRGRSHHAAAPTPRCERRCDRDALHARPRTRRRRRGLGLHEPAHAGQGSGVVGGGRGLRLGAQGAAPWRGGRMGRRGRRPPSREAERGTSAPATSDPRRRPRAEGVRGRRALGRRRRHEPRPSLRQHRRRRHERLDGPVLRHGPRGRRGAWTPSA